MNIILNKLYLLNILFTLWIFNFELLQDLFNSSSLTPGTLDIHGRFLASKLRPSINAQILWRSFTFAFINKNRRLWFQINGDPTANITLSLIPYSYGHVDIFCFALGTVDVHLILTWHLQLVLCTNWRFLYSHFVLGGRD